MSKKLYSNSFKIDKYSLMLLFLLLFRVYCFPNENRRLEILVEGKQLLTDNIEPNDKIEEKISRIDSILYQKNISDHDFMDLTTSMIKIFREQGKLTLAIEFLLNAASYYEQIVSPSEEQIELLVHLYIPLGASHEELGMWNRALEFYLKALNLSEEYNFESSTAKVYNNIGAIYYSKGELTSSEEYTKKAMEINKKLNDKKELFINYNNLAGIYIQRKDYNLALDYALQAIQQLDRDKDPYLYYFMQSNIGGLYTSKQDYSLALSYLNNAKENQLLYNFTSDLVQTYSLLAKTYEMMGRYDLAKYYIDKSLEQARKLDNKHIESRVLSGVAEYYEKRNDYKNAYLALKQSSLLSDSILRIDNQRKISEFETVYDAEKKMRENALIIENITVQKLASDRLRLVMIIIALFLILIILFLINRSRNNEKMRKANELLASHQLELYEKEKQLQQNIKQELNYTIDKKNRELTFYTLNLVKNNEFISDLKEELKQLLLELNPKDKARKDHVREILIKIQQQNISNNWEEFRYYFEQVHPSFYETLENKFPDLTPKEKRLCAYLRLGLSSKDIAAITFKEVRSVESSRNRLRKKLGIGSDENLNEFLQNFTNNDIIS